MANEKQNLQMLAYIDFTGGMNSSAPPTSLQDNEYQLIRNMEFNYNKLVTRGGLSAPLVTFDDNIEKMHYYEGPREMAVTLENRQAYHVDNSFAKTLMGNINGAKRPVMCEFDGKLFLAAGEKLQCIDYFKRDERGDRLPAGVRTIQASHACDNVLTKLGRLTITHEGDDYMWQSAVGDPEETGWTEDTNDDSSAKMLEIGYKDNGDLITGHLIAGDLVFFKSNGRAYRVSNEFPDWLQTDIAAETDVINKEAIVNVGSYIAFMTRSGLKTLTTTEVYGNFRADELARKINRSLAAYTFEPRLYNIVRKRQLIIFPDTSSDESLKHCYIYQYDLGAGFEVDFAIPVYDMVDTPDGVLIASGKSIYRWSSEYDTDNGVPIEQEIISKKYASSNRLYTRMVDIGIEGTLGDQVKMQWADKTINYTIPDKRRMIHVFSVCRESEFHMLTSAKVSLEYIKLYMFER